MAAVHFKDDDVQIDITEREASLNISDHSLPTRGDREISNASFATAPPAPPEQHRRTTIEQDEEYQRRNSDSHHRHSTRSRSMLRYTHAFGGVSKRAALRQIIQIHKKEIIQRRTADTSDLSLLGSSGDVANRTFSIETEEDDNEPTERSTLMSSGDAKDLEVNPWQELKEMFTESKINILFVFIPLAYWSHAHGWSDGSVFILNFLAMVPLASMLGVFTEELAAHTNDVIGGLLNATFGNAVELVVAIQALLASDYRVVQASLIGSIFSNLLLVLGMCFFCGGIIHSEQEFIAQGAVASIALLAFNGLIMLLPNFLGEEGGTEDTNVELVVSRIGATLLVFMYAQLLWFQLKTHVHLFEGDDDVVALIPFSWALIGLVVITGLVTILSEWLVGSIDGFCEEFNLGRSFVGVIILPVVGNAVEHISAVSVAMKNKMDLALGIALGSSVQIGLFVLPLVVLIGACTGHEMSLKFPSFEVYLYLLAVIIVSLCLGNERSNWLEGSLLVCTYIIVGVGIYFEKEVPGAL
mmetsp:Transcript_22999/g.48500  ORF Transcript_22999/g.48500 Transcript_22999/m.48500 type:complete len:526 (-) Transcript_22999:53-1630(-)